MIKAIEEARAKHWNDLAILVDKIVAWWRKYCFEEPHYPSAYILDDPDFESVNYILASSLLAHLKAEFPDCRDMTDWKELVATNLNPDIVVSMRLVAFRRTFVGNCGICQSWENAATAGEPHGTASGGNLLPGGGIHTQDVVDSLSGSNVTSFLKSPAWRPTRSTTPSLLKNSRYCLPTRTLS